MRTALGIALLGLAAAAGFLGSYWAWREFADWRNGRQERRARRRAPHLPPPE